MPLPTADAIDALLPQTQCTRCGYAACRPYAEAIADGSAEINRCPPGGATTIDALAAITGRAALPLDPACGEELPVARIAKVIEADCIGCTKCIQACPVDAIIGAANLMHTIIDAQCTGCELCIPPCPVDCIVMLDAPGLTLPRLRSAEFRGRYLARESRLQRWDREDRERRRAHKATTGMAVADRIAAALARAQSRAL